MSFSLNFLILSFPFPLSYQIIPNVIFIFSVLAILLIILRRLPDAAVDSTEPRQPSAHTNLAAKGLPVEALSKLRVYLRLWFKRAWNFILEAKDLKPYSAAGYQMKKIFGGKFPGAQKSPQPKPAPVIYDVKNEKYYLDIIKLQPKNLANYDGLGRFYIERENFSDSRDIYLYLTSHQPANADYHARLAYCLYQVKDYQKAAESYKQSLALDSTQPNRYYNLALCQEAAGDLASSVTSLQTATRLESGNIKYYLSLSAILTKTGNTQKAKEILQQAARLDPANATVKEKLASLNYN